MYQEAAMLEEHVLKVSIKANGALHPATLGAQSNLAETSVIIYSNIQIQDPFRTSLFDAASRMVAPDHAPAIA
jgi:hypothetical protein